jgi:hypothetical protein
VKWPFLGFNELSRNVDNRVESVSLFDSVGHVAEELADDAGRFLGQTSWLDDGDRHGFFSCVAANHKNGVTDFDVRSLMVTVRISVGDKRDIAESLDAGERVAIGGVLFGTGKVDTVNVEGDHAAERRRELDLVHDDVLVRLVLELERRVSLDRESAGSIGEKHELGIGFRCKVEADWRLVLGRDHEVRVAISRAVVISPTVVGLVSWLVIVA